jgi:hypothetical protein
MEENEIIYPAEDLIIIVPEERDILDNGMQMFREQIVSHQGRWKISLNDPDPWPSDPHGDRQDAPEKLNIYNGEVFSKKDHSYQYSLSKKAMNFIYKRIMASKYTKIKDVLTTNASLFTYSIT